MKIKTTFIMALIPIVGFCSSTLEERVAELESKIKKLEEIILTPSNLGVIKPDGEHFSEKNGVITLKSWSYAYKQGSFSQYYEIKYTLKNNYDKQVKLINGSIEFSDLLGESFFSIRIDPDIRIDSKDSATDSGNYGINEFFPGQIRMIKMQKEDIVATLIIRKLVFEDNTILEF